MTGSNTAPLYDSQEFLRDGGDAEPVVRRISDRSFRGLQPEDTIVHYRNGSGDVEIQSSNQVALYAPRFRSVRQVSGGSRWRKSHWNCSNGSASWNSEG